MRFCAFCLTIGLAVLTNASTPSGALHSLRSAAAPSVDSIRQWKSVLHHSYRMLEARRLDQLAIPLGAANQFARRYPAHPYAAKTAEYNAYELLLRFQIPEATREYLRAKQLALAAGDVQTVAIAMHALSNIYLQAGNFDGAREAVEQALRSLPARSKPRVKAGVLIQYARVLSRNGRFSQALEVFSEVIATAEREGFTELRADAWKLSSREYALLGNLEKAEHAIRESLRIRALTGDREMASDYHDLADIMIRAGEPRQALEWLDRAAARASESLRFSSWRIDALRGRAHLALQDSAQALEETRRSVRAFRASRTFLLPGDWLRSHSTPSDDPQALLVDAALAEFDRTGRPALLAEAFAASEARRAFSLRAANGVRVPSAHADRYWRTVSDVDAAYTEMMQNSPDSAAAAAAQRKLTQFRLALAEIEASLDTAMTKASSRLVAPSSQHVRPGEAFISFQLGEPVSYAWTLTRDQLAVTRLPGRARIEAEKQVWLRDVSSAEAAAVLYRTLFGGLPPSVHQAKSWLLAIEGPLFETPLSALVTGVRTGQPSRPAYLIEDHSLQLVPGSWTLDRRLASRHAGLFLGVGDPVYNHADPRRHDSAWRLFEASASAELARLAGSGAEVEQCSRQWPSSRILAGPDANPVRLSHALSEFPYAAIHLAVHVVPAPDAPQENLVALSLDADGRPTYIGPEWIGARRVGQSLVVMNGCRSGSGTVTGEGLMGLTRAWLRAGATRVLSTYWPTNDNGGTFAREFYNQFLSRKLTHAEALRQAQLTMAQSTDWRANPRHWAAYFLTGYPE